MIERWWPNAGLELVEFHLLSQVVIRLNTAVVPLRSHVHDVVAQQITEQLVYLRR